MDAGPGRFFLVNGTDERVSVFAAGTALGLPTACALVVDGVAAPDPAAGWRLDLPTAAPRLQAVFAATLTLLATL